MESPENARFGLMTPTVKTFTVGTRPKQNPPFGGFFVFLSFGLAALCLNVRPGGFVVGSPTSQHTQMENVSCSRNTGFQASIDFQILLGEAIKKMENLDAEFLVDRERLLALRTRLEEGRFHLAVLGQFKRGKSTLLNAFLGQALLPTSVVPLTAIPTFLEYGPDVRIRVRYQDEKPVKEFTGASMEESVAILQGLVTEEGNPKNRLGLVQVEILHPAPILQHGVVLIDTPGIGSTFTHNTEATLHFLPQCDAALFVVSADPPLTEVEAEFLKAVKSRVARLFFIFNKIDYLDERERDAALTFFKKVLSEKIGADEEYPIFCLSARRGLDAKILDDSHLWTHSGLREVENHLVCFLASEKSNTLREALGRKVRDVIEDVLMRLRLSIKSLQMPLEDLERRLGVFARELRNAERERIAVQDLLGGDRKRTLELLEQEAEALRKRSAVHLERVVEASFSAMKDGDISEQAILDGLAEEVTMFFQTSAQEASRSFGLHVTETLRPHQRRADDLIELIRKAAAQLFEISYHAPDSSEAFAMKRRPHWVLRKRVPSLPIVVPEEALDRLLPATIRITRLKKRLSRQIDTLVRHNVENLRWATLQNLNDAFRRFGLTLDQRFQETIAATHGAIQAAYDKRKEHAEAIADDVSRFDAAATELAKICAEIQR
jgi:GTP-binding protein EngB required for normal cell division